MITERQLALQFGIYKQTVKRMRLRGLFPAYLYEIINYSTQERVFYQDEAVAFLANLLRRDVQMLNK